MDNFSATAARMLPGVGSPVSVGGGMFDITAIPGFDLVQRLFLKLGLDSSVLVTIGMSLTLLTSLFSFFTYSISSVTTLTRFISANLVSSATVHSSDVTYLYVMRWLAANHVSTDCRLFCVTSRKNPMSHAVKRFSSYGPYGDASARNEEDDDDDLDGLDGSCEEDRLGPKLKYTPAPGFLYFWYKKNLILINRKLDLTYYTGDIPDETMILTTIGRSPNLLRELLAEARREYLLAQAKKTTVYTISPTPFAQKSWDQGRHRPSRDISTVILPPESKKLLLRDVKEYLNPVTARWYAQRGLPYRRGYLFYGPPGTGKTSLSLALAGELKVPLYILSLSTGSLTDETLTMLFVGLPKKCIVLLEDIDCAGVQRNNNGNFMFDDSDSEEDDEEDYSSDSDSKSGASKNKETKSKKKTTNKMEATTTGPHNRMKTSVSFSGLLNAIDGVASHEGRILIMTTNHRERLDPALIRPGRVDMQVEFGYAGRDTLEEIFRELYSQVDGMDSATIEEEEEVFGGEDEPLIPSEKKARNEIDRQAQYTHLIAELAEKFARMIPADKFTPAEVQGFLISYKRAPRLAIRNLPAWLDSKRSANEKKGLKKTKKAKSEETPESRKPGPSKGLSVNTMGLHNDELRNLLTEIINTVLKDNKILQHDNKANKAPPTPISPTSPTPVKNEVTTIERPVDLGYNE
ncbi:P-loop containing nucleoside triphosphate hydrolase protein [Morchella conica CCBAS932]|uniref:P-loop containing nucleoside triphosphate hydrolase protein n=1 Tax=Morchella conica CCBAS932 TaxID=1392247 RepID=A0A3N4L1G7_9PEZI|nr:P-loop containing nucleoside triphosphate hydrolase protein [Morchella conica CCBAS932]